MARIRRIKFADANEGYYHIMSRTIQRSFILKKKEKEQFLKLLRKLARVYFVKVIGLSIMNNHVHLVIQMINPEDIPLNELQERFEVYYNEGTRKLDQRVFIKEKAYLYYNRFSDVSCFIQDLKQRFSRWYNRKHHGCGTVWADRFKSTLLKGDKALLACLIYVELNSIRAGIVKKPEKYRYCSLAFRLAGGDAGTWLNQSVLADALKEMFPPSTELKPLDIVQAYYKLVYSEGMEAKEGKAHIKEADTPSYNRKQFARLSYKHRIRHFTDGLFLGSQEFCNEKFLEFQKYFQTSRIRTGKRVFRRRSPDGASPAATLQELHSIRSYYY